MMLLGMQYFNIDAKRKQNFTKPPKINNQTKIIEIKEQDVNELGKKALVVIFEYRADYLEEKKSIAHILINGGALLVDKSHNEIIKAWKKDKKIPEKENLQIINIILKESMLKALNISQEMKLPPIVRLPFASAKKPQQESRYIG